MGVINKQTVTFEVYMQEVATAAYEDYNYELTYKFNVVEFYEYYNSGCDVHEAILKHQETL